MRRSSAGVVALLLSGAFVVGPAGSGVAGPAVSVCDTPTSSLGGGTTDAINVHAGDVLLLTSGTYTGVLHLRDGGTLCVAADAALEPKSMKSPAGRPDRRRDR